MRKTRVTRVLVMLLLVAVFAGAVPVGIRATESVSVNDMTEKQNQITKVDTPLL